MLHKQLSLFIGTLPNKQKKIRLIYDKAGKMEFSSEHYSAPTGRLMLKLVAEPMPCFLAEQFEHKFVDSALREFYSCFVSDANTYDHLFVNKHGVVSEGTRSNFYVEYKGRLITSPIESGLLPGIYRELLIEQGCVIEPITLKMLRCANRFFISNALIGKREAFFRLE